MGDPHLIILRSSLAPGDLGSIVRLHGVTYALENGFDATFEAYVAETLAEFVRRSAPRDRIWIAEREGEIVGCVAIVAASETQAQLRWFLVAPSARGSGLGRRLLREAITFARGEGYTSVFLRTVSALTTAARLYREVGFSKVEERPSSSWGVKVIEERYGMGL